MTDGRLLAARCHALLEVSNLLHDANNVLAELDHVKEDASEETLPLLLAARDEARRLRADAKAALHEL